MAKKPGAIRIMLFSYLSCSFLGCNENEAIVNDPPPKSISYEVSRRWTIPNGGRGKEIVIDPSLKNDSSLKLLGDQLRRETIKDRHAVAIIFDDPRAARIHADAIADRLNSEDLKFHDSHFLGDYIKNGNTGYHQLQYGLNGFMNDPIIVVTY